MPDKPRGGAASPLVTLFDRVAESYDRVGPSFFRLFAEPLAAAAALEPGARVLDLATGRAAVLIAAARMLQDHGRLHGIDLSTAMLARALPEVRRIAGDTAHLHRMDAAALAFSNDSFDRVLCGFGLDLCDDSAAVLRECFRVLVPGGVLSLTVWAADCPYFLWLAHSLDASQNQLKIRSQPPPAPAKTRSGLRRLLTGAGFAEVSIEQLDREIVYPDLEEWWQSLWTHCPRGILERFRAQTMAGVKRRMLRRAEEARREEGLAVELRAYLARGRKVSATP